MQLIRAFSSALAGLATVVIATAGSPALSSLELTAVSGVGDSTYVCLVERASARGHWLAVGVERDGLLAEQYDPVRNAVLIRAGSQTRWIPLRRHRIRSIPVARNADGSVDWIHMNMTDREKEREAQSLQWDILNISYLGRTGQLGARPPPDIDTNTSQPR